MTVARTGEGYLQFISKREKARRQFGPTIMTWSSGQFSSLEQMHWDWDHILAFNSVPALSRVRCPVLGVFGEQDPLTDARDASRALSGSANTDLTVMVFPNAGHSLAELPSASRMAPGVFETLRSCLLGHVRVPARKANQVASATCGDCPRGDSAGAGSTMTRTGPLSVCPSVSPLAGGARRAVRHQHAGASARRSSQRRWTTFLRDKTRI
jgi:hypothetical protein